MKATPPLPAESLLPDRRWSSLGWVAGTALFAGVLAYGVRAWEAGDFGIERVRYGPLAIAFVLLAAGYAAQCFAWHLIVRASGMHTSLSVNSARWSLSVLGKYVPGKVWHGLGRLYLYRNEPNGVAAVAGAFLIELLVSVAAAAQVAFLAFMLARNALPLPLLIAVAALALCSIAGAMTPWFDRGAVLVTARVLKQEPPLRIHTSARIAPFLWELVAYVAFGVGCYALALAVQSVPLFDAPGFIGALCLSGLAGIIAFFVPAGLGVREGAMIWLLSFFVSPGFAATFAIATRVWLTAGEAVVVLVGVVLARHSKDD